MNYSHVFSNGADIFYHERGTGEPLILIMGFGADGLVWEKHAAVYEKHFRCIIPDNRGVGLSGQPKGPYSTKMMADDIVAVMDHAKVEKACVVGISMGGAIAQELAINFPGRVKCMVLVSTWAKFNKYAKKVYENLKHIRASVPVTYFMDLLFLWIFAAPHYEQYLPDLENDAIAAGKNPKLQSQEGFEGQLDACINHDATSRLNQIKVPVLVTVGARDIFTPLEFSETIHQNIQDSAFLVFPEGGHAHHWEDLERFNKETLAFLLRHNENMR